MNQENKNQISVSVVIPAYNSGAFIARAIDSVLNQTLAPYEIIVVDDGSTDDTAHVVKKYDNVKYIHQQNAGASVARNTGIEAATGNWIAFLDADDEWLKNKLKLQTEHLQRNPSLAWASTNFILCLCDANKQSHRIAPKKAAMLLKGKEYFDNYFKALLKGSSGWTGTMLIKKDTLFDCGLFRIGQPLANDLDMWFRIAYKYPDFGFVPEPLAIYHMNVPNSITATQTDLKILIDFLRMHIELSKKHNCLNDLSPWIRQLITLRIRSLLFENKPEKIKLLIDEFGDLLNPSFKLLISTLMICPGLTASACHLISKVVRKLKLRSPVIPPPKKPKQ